jgi:hypothetical protein
MTDANQSETLRQQILRTLEQAGEQDLAALHQMLNRPQKDVTILPIVGGLVSGGFLEKVTTPKPSPFPNAPVSAAQQRRSSQPVPVRFRLTDQGRELLRAAGVPPAPAPEPVAAAAGIEDEDDPFEDEDGEEA